MKNIFKVTILFCIILGIFLVPSFAISNDISFEDTNQPIHQIPYTYNSSNISNFTAVDGVPCWGSRHLFVTPLGNNIIDNSVDFYCFGVVVNTSGSSTTVNLYVVTDSLSVANCTYVIGNPTSYNMWSSNSPSWQSQSNYNLKSAAFGTQVGVIPSQLSLPLFDSADLGYKAVRNYIDNPPSDYSKNENVDEFIANTLISMGIRYSQFSDALSIASSAWNYIIDENNWYIGSGDRNDKDIVWDINSTVSYANAQSNNYLDWYNGYKVNKDLTVALTKFISDNYTASSLGQGTLAGYNVSYDSNYSYSAGGYGFGGSPSAYSFYPASTITYFNGAYLHDNDSIDQDEFVYSPADVRKFIGYPSSAGIIDPPDSTNGTGVITDGNGDTVYNIDLDFPSFDWLANAIQAILDFLDRLITTIADFLTQILDAILSLFSDAFESLTEFGEGIIEWLYAIIAGFSTIGSNYIPASLWAVILPFILINIGVGLIMFVMRSH